jgi:hypothetical protein
VELARLDAGFFFHGVNVESMAAPLGNQNAVKAKRWQQAIDRALEKRSKADGIAELDRLAERFLAEVEAAGITGFRELGDRLDGKPAQAIVNGDDGAFVIEQIQRSIIDP